MRLSTWVEKELARRKWPKTQSKDREHWTKFANEWIAWARKPGHDAFWAYRGRLVEYFGEGSGAALEVGCGEGRISRVLKSCGYKVTATDPVAQFINAAKETASADEYATCAADDLPFPDHSFDLVVAYNVLMDIENVPAALKEMRRVMRPTGILMISIVHPFADIGRFIDETANAPFVITGSYFGRKQFEGSEVRDGLRMPFFGWSQPLHQYVTAARLRTLVWQLFRSANLCPEDKVGSAEHMKKWTRMPRALPVV